MAGRGARLVQCPCAGVRAARREGVDRRPRARPARRQPDRPALYRRLCRRPPVRDAAEVRPGPGDAMAAMPKTASRLPAAASSMRCAASRRKTGPRARRRPPAGPFSPPRSTPCRKAARCWRSGASPMTRCLPRSASGARPGRSPTGRCTGSACGPPARRQLPLLALQHQYRAVDRGHVRGGRRGHAGGGCGGLTAAPFSRASRLRGRAP